MLVISFKPNLVLLGHAACVTDEFGQRMEEICFQYSFTHWIGLKGDICERIRRKSRRLRSLQISSRKLRRLPLQQSIAWVEETEVPRVSRYGSVFVYDQIFSFILGSSSLGQDRLLAEGIQQLILMALKRDSPLPQYSRQPMTTN